MPPTTALSGTSFVTTAFAPIATLLPTLILPTTFAPAPIYTPSPIIGIPLFSPFPATPIVTPCDILQLRPITAPPDIIIPQNDQYKNLRQL